MDIVYQVFREVSSIQLPTGFSFGSFILFLWSVPLVLILIKKFF